MVVRLRRINTLLTSKGAEAVSTERPVFNLAILTISDAGSKGERADTSGDAISEAMAREGFCELYRRLCRTRRS